MLRALGEHLKLLAADPASPYTATLRRLTGPREAVRYGQNLRRMILALPAMISELRSWSDAPGTPARVMRMQRFALAHLYAPIDFLCAHHSALFSYLDDAYLIASVYHRALEEPQGAGRRTRGADRALAGAVPDWIGLAGRLLPKETSKIDELLDEVAQGRSGRVRRRQERRAKRTRAGSRPDRADGGRREAS